MSATLTPSAPASSTHSAPADGQPCPKCGSKEPWGFGSWCPSCGYYPKLGVSVEMSSPKEPGSPAAAAGQATGEEPQSVEWSKVVPLWAWVLLAGVVAVVGGSVLASRSLPEVGSERISWTVLQALAGGLLAFGGQLAAYLHAIRKSDKFGPFDVFMKPIEVWKPTFARLPEGAYRLWMGGWGLAAVIGALTLIGGIDYAAIFDPKAKPKTAPNIVQSVVSQARKEREGGAESLDEAMNQFVGEADAAADGADGDKKDPKKPDGPTEDCVIFGYTLDEDGSLAMLRLASMVKGELRFVATVTAEDLPSDVRASLVERFKSLRQSKSAVRTTYKALWLKPKLMCRVAHKGWTRDRKLKNAAFVEMLPDVDAKANANTASL